MEKWEIVNQAFVADVMSSYNITGMSSVIQVKSQYNNPVLEPGNHGSVVTQDINVRIAFPVPTESGKREERSMDTLRRFSVVSLNFEAFL